MSERLLLRSFLVTQSFLSEVPPSSINCQNSIARQEDNFSYGLSGSISKDYLVFGVFNHKVVEVK